jgi:hypothetical protein
MAADLTPLAPLAWLVWLGLRQFYYVIHLHAQRADWKNPDSDARERKTKMPYEELRKLFEHRNDTRPSFWQRITPGSAAKWALAGVLSVVAVLLLR